MRRAKFIAAALALTGWGLAVTATPAHAAGGGGLVSAGSVTLANLPGIVGAEGLSSPETPTLEGDAAAEHGAGPGRTVKPTALKAAGAELANTFAGLNHRDNRLANGGNQFSSEPPDQALCVGPGHVLEGVNTVFRVYDKAGSPASRVISYNEFFGYPPSINRTTGVRGAFLTDPVCHFDSDTGRFFMVVLTIDQAPVVNGPFTGKNRLDIAVSKTSDPTGAWFLYKLPVQNDGTDGTPDHKCAPDPAAPPGRTNPAACLGDFPHIGFDAFGAWVTTNEYSFFGDATTAGQGSLYNGSQIYGISKRSIANGTPGPLVTFEGPHLGPFQSFTVWPAVSPAGKAKGTEFFLSSTLGDGSETGNFAPTENRIGVWAATNTRSLETATPNVKLINKLIKADTYALPPRATQKDGPAPQRDCLNDRSNLLAPGIDCWQALVGTAPPTQVLGQLDASDTRMNQVISANGTLYGAVGTAVSVAGEQRAGVLWMAVEAQVDDGRKLEAETKRSGYLALAGNDVTYPATGLTSRGKVVIGVTVTGNDHFPSAGYAVLGRGGDDEGEGDGKSTITIASEGKGPQDGFTEYPPVSGQNRPRWGDYGATAMDGDTLWLANESIEQSCTLQEYVFGVNGFGSCGRTRTALANWGTRISAIKL